MSQGGLFREKRKAFDFIEIGPAISTKKPKLDHTEWLQDIRAACIAVEGRPDLHVLIVSRKQDIVHCEVVEPTVDMDHTTPLSLPMLPGRHRISMPDTKLTEKEELEG